MNQLLLCDKYRPRRLDALDVDVTDLKKHQFICNSIILGCSGSGKMTVAQAWLEHIFGEDTRSLKRHSIEYRVNGKSIDVSYLFSNYHFVLQPDLYGVYDKHILQQFIKDIACTANVAQLGNDSTHKYKVIVIKNADQLTEGAQNALRQTVEEYSEECRFIFLARVLNRFTDAMISRTLKIAVFADALRVNRCLTRVSSQEGISISADTIDFISLQCNGNLREALHCVDRYRAGLPICCDALQASLEPIIDYVTNRQLNHENMTKIRAILYNALITGVRPQEILRVMTKLFYSDVDDDHKYEVLCRAAQCNNKLIKVNKSILLLEKFILDMYVLKATHKSAS